ncbi:GL12359 [Drosophila persimilis]|uniref:GL12359 n=1 Tax=Drosophila persimilis TaxID=7234 RepID=B4GMA9_DROPE|nr:GL12359 [Drosophila persimilis]
MDCPDVERSLGEIFSGYSSQKFSTIWHGVFGLYIPDTQSLEPDSRLETDQTTDSVFDLSVDKAEPQLAATGPNCDGDGDVAAVTVTPLSLPSLVNVA